MGFDHVRQVLRRLPPVVRIVERKLPVAGRTVGILQYSPPELLGNWRCPPELLLGNWHCRQEASARGAAPVPRGMPCVAQCQALCQPTWRQPAPTPILPRLVPAAPAAPRIRHRACGAGCMSCAFGPLPPGPRILRPSQSIRRCTRCAPALPLGVASEGRRPASVRTAVVHERLETRDQLSSAACAAFICPRAPRASRGCGKWLAAACIKGRRDASGFR